jgi:hypothetical protein
MRERAATVHYSAVDVDAWEATAGGREASARPREVAADAWEAAAGPREVAAQARTTTY